MVERTADDEKQLRGEVHIADEIVCAGSQGSLGKHHSLGLACGACGVEYVHNVRGEAAGFHFITDSLEIHLKCLILKRNRNSPEIMHGTIGHDEGYVLGGAEDIGTVFPQSRCLQFFGTLHYGIPEVPVSDSVSGTFNGNLVRGAGCVKSYALFQCHHFSASLVSTIFTIESMLRKFLGVASSTFRRILKSLSSNIIMVAMPRESSSPNRKSRSKSTVGIASESNL